MCNFSLLSVHCCVLVVIPLSSDHSVSLCTASYNVRTVPLAVRIRSNNGNSPSFSCVRRCQCPPHKRKTLSDTCTVQAPFRPVLYAFLMYTCRCTTRCYTRSHVWQPLIPSYFCSDKLPLASGSMFCCGRCGEERPSYISLNGNVLDTEEEGETLRQSASRSVVCVTRGFLSVGRYECPDRGAVHAIHVISFGRFLRLLTPLFVAPLLTA